MKYKYSLHSFSDLETCGFSPKDYSMLKFGSDLVAKQFGFALADGVFKNYCEILLANKCVIIPSPYNFVRNAATIMTHYFVNKLNEYVVTESGNHVDYSLIHRKVSYINDYGFLDKASRSKLISNDDFYMNTEYLDGKLLIFVDDVKITGTHEDRLIDIMEKRGIGNDCIFTYFAEYTGNDATIESKLNFSSINSPYDYVNLLESDPSNHIIIRPIKMLLGSDKHLLREVVRSISKKQIEKIYFGCLGEGYYMIPKYQENFSIISESYHNEMENK